MPDGNILGETIFGEELDGENIGSLSSGESTPLAPPEVEVLPGGTGFLVTFNQDVTGGSGFTFFRSGVEIAVFGYTSPTAATRRYYPQAAILLGDVITMDYGPGDIQDLAGNNLEAIDGQDVENNSEVSGGSGGSYGIVAMLSMDSIAPIEGMRFTAGDTNVNVQYTLRDGSGNIVPVSPGAVVKLLLKRVGSNTTTTVTGTVPTAQTGGIVQATLATVPAAGRYNAQWSINGLTYPLGSMIPVLINESLD